MHDVHVVGKTLTVIAALHTALTCPSLISVPGRIQPAVLLVVPANTRYNWMAEVEKWTGSLTNPLIVRDLGDVKDRARPNELRNWNRQGGILLMSGKIFLQLSDKIGELAQPDIMVLDEAHTMVKNSGNKTFEKMKRIQTKRKILMTGTPLENNVTEYYQIIKYARPEALGDMSVARFEKYYR